MLSVLFGIIRVPAELYERDWMVVTANGWMSVPDHGMEKKKITEIRRPEVLKDRCREGLPHLVLERPKHRLPRQKQVKELHIVEPMTPFIYQIIRLIL